MAKKFITIDNDVGFRLSLARKRAGITQMDAARAIGADSNAPISRWEKSKDEPQIGALIVLSKLYGVSIDWILTGSIPTSTIAETPEIVFVSSVENLPRLDLTGQYVAVPLLADSVAAGSPSEIRDYNIESWAVIFNDRSWLPHGSNNYTCVRVKGLSMAPILMDGDIVAIDHADRPRNAGDLFRYDLKMMVFRLDGGVTIKWLKYDEKTETIIGVPENKDELDHLIVLSGDSIYNGIVGKVRWWWAKR